MTKSFVKTDWQEVSDRAEALALKLKLHFEAGTSDGAHAVKGALEEVGDAAERAFEALSAAVRDPAVKDDVTNLGARLREAIGNTFAEVESSVRR